MDKIPKINTPVIEQWKVEPPQVLNIPVHVTVPLGFPIIDMPGCVVSRKSNRENSALINNDPDGNVVLCQAEYPSYDAMDYTPEELLYTQEAEPQRYPQPPIPAADAPPPKKIEDCPPAGAA